MSPDDTLAETKRLRLREWRQTDSSLLWEHCNTAEVMRHLLGRRMTRKEHDVLFEWLCKQFKDYKQTFWALEDKKTGDFLGFAGTVRLDEPDSTVFDCVEVGWRIRHSADG